MTASPKKVQANINIAESVEEARFEYTVDRYYYTPKRRFEQSLDVYKPVRRNNKKDDDDTTYSASQPKIPVVLVMGSGWLGHKPYFYVMTNWWNSSAPKQICGRLGHPCISIRHSGGYLFGAKARSVSLRHLFLCLLVVIVVTLSMSLSPPPLLVVAMITTFALYREGKGAAGIDDMVSDVSIALSYIDAHIHEWDSRDVRATDAKDSEKTPIVFGGYSSGAHVAATLLTSSSLSPFSSSPSSNGIENPSFQSNQMQKRREQQQKLKRIRIHSILYISGVLDISPESSVMTLVSRVVLGNPPLQIPSPLRTLRSFTGTQIRGNKLNKGNQDEINHGMLQLVSLPPHILIGCKREVFGWSVLDSSFCASEYADALRVHNSDSRQSRNPTGDEDGGGDRNNENNSASVRLILLEGWAVNHWSILSSIALRNALRPVLTAHSSKTCGVP